MHEKLLEERHQGIAVLSKRGELMAANRLFKEVTGYVEHEIVAFDMDALFLKCQNASVLPQRDWRLVRTDLKKKDGSSWSTILCIKELMDDQGACYAYLIRADEDTDVPRTGIGAVGESDQDTVQLGHDLRNVFAAIVGGVQLMKSTSYDQEIQRRLVNLENAVESGLNILEKLPH